MRNNDSLLIGLLSVLVVVALLGCAGESGGGSQNKLTDKTPTSSQEPIVGTWKDEYTVGDLHQTIKMVFMSNGEYIVKGEGGWTGTWEKIGNNKYSLKKDGEQYVIAVYEESSDTWYEKNAPSSPYQRVKDSQNTEQHYNDKAFIGEMESQGATLRSDWQGISKYARASDYSMLSTYCSYLKSDARDFQRVIKDYRLSSEMQEVRDKYITGLEKYEKAGRYCKQGATNMNPDDIEKANKMAEQGIKYIEEAYQMAGISSNS
ncbi:MAG: hypothetical protein R6U44_06820 [Archaeoglobaceae archaeon]